MPEVSKIIELKSGIFGELFTQIISQCFRSVCVARISKGKRHSVIQISSRRPSLHEGGPSSRFGSTSEQSLPRSRYSVVTRCSFLARS
jgi:hypothetical protein